MVLVSFFTISQAQIIIDDFSIGEFVDTNDVNQGVYISQELNDYYRVINSLALNPTGPEIVEQSVQNGEYTFNVESTSGGVFEVFIYCEEFVSGIPTSGTGFVQAEDLEPFYPTMDLSEATTLNLSLSSASANVVQVQFFFYTPDMSNMAIDQSEPISISGAGTYSIDLTNFFDAVDPANIGALGYSIGIVGSGNYSIDNFWCDTNATPLIPDFEADFTLVDPGDEVTFTDLSTGNITSWFWEFEGGNPETSTEQNPLVIYSEPGFYDVSLTISDGVGSQTIVKEDYIEVDNNTSINDVGQNYIDFYPNPTTGLVHLKGIENAQISVFNSTGTLVASQYNSTGNQIDLSDLGTGIYFIKVFSQNQIITKKLLIE